MFLLLVTFCGMLYLRKSSMALRRKAYPPLQIQQMGIPFHPGMQTNSTLLPDSSVILGRRPVGTYSRNSPWIHPEDQNGEWANQPSELKENLLSSFDIPLGAYSTDTVASPYATATLAMQKQGRCIHGCPHNPYNEVAEENGERKYHYENNACLPVDHSSSLSSRSHQSHPETLSVHSQRSSPRSARSNSQQQKATFLPTLNWADILPPPPKCPPPPSEVGHVGQKSAANDHDDYSALYYDGNGVCGKCAAESGDEGRETGNVQDIQSQRPEPPPRNPRMAPTNSRSRNAVDRNHAQKTAALQMLAGLSRTRSFESSITGDGENRTGMCRICRISVIFRTETSLVTSSARLLIHLKFGEPGLP